MKEIDFNNLGYIYKSGDKIDFDTFNKPLCLYDQIKNSVIRL